MIVVFFINKKVINYSLHVLFELRKRVVNKYLITQFNKITSRNRSELILNSGSVIVEFSQVLLSVFRLIGETIILTIILFFLATIDIKLLLFIILFFFTILIFYYVLFGKSVGFFGEKINSTSSALIKLITELFVGFKQIRILAKENYFLKKILYHSKQYIDFSEKIQVIQLMPKYVFEFTIICLFVLLTFIFQNDQSYSNNYFSTFGFFIFAALRLYPTFSIISSSLITIRSKKNSINRVYQELNNKYTDHWSKNIIENKKSRISYINFEKIDIKNVSFSHDTSDKEVFRNLNFTINKNEMIGIMGPSGSGKSTLIDIVIGLIEVSKGEVLINNQKLYDEISFIRENVGLLPQDIFILDESAVENIILDDTPNIKDNSKIKNILNSLNLESRFDLDYENIVGDSGNKLSGGEKQRLGLARILFNNRNILIFDECTSALDEENARQVLEQIKKIRHNKTIIIISHEKHILNECDKIYKVENKSLKLIN